MLDQDRILAIAAEHLSAEEAAGAAVRWDTQPRRAGERIRLGPQEQSMPFDGYFVFIDLAPMMNWSHPARVLMIAEDGGDVVAHEASFPPFPDRAYPESFRILRLGRSGEG